MFSRTRTKVCAFIGTLCLAAVSADARPIVLAWDANPEPDVRGYILSYGTQPGEYSESIDVGNLITWPVDLPGPQYYFAVRAYDADGNLSPYSLEVGDSADVLLINPGNQFTETDQPSP